LLAAFAPLASGAAAWTHGWDTALESQFIDYGYSVLTAAQAANVASHYAVASLEKCTGPGPTEANVWSTAAQLKAIKPAMKVLFYWDLDQQALSCYAAHAAYMQRPDFWLRDDGGGLTFNASDGTPHMDYTVAEARAWWVSVPLNGTGSPAAHLIDGVLADGTGSRCPQSSAGGAGLSPARCAALIAAKSAMVRELQALLDATNGGSVLGNGLDMYPGGPPDHNLYTLADMDGIMGEHFAVFESVLPSGALNVSLVAEFMADVTTAAKAGKTVVVALWPGLCVTPFTKDGYPSWPGNTQPNTTDGWRAALLAKHSFALAAFLTVAEANVFMQFEGWYSLSQGAIQCPDAPESCSAPDPWYPQLFQPLGAPLAPAARTGNVWTRSFAHAVVTLDLDDPDSSGVVFSSEAAAVSAAASAAVAASPADPPVTSGTPVQVWPCNASSPRQVWKVDAAQQQIRLGDVHGQPDSGLVLNVLGYSNATGGVLNAWVESANGCQERAYDTATGRLVSPWNGLCAGTVNASGALPAGTPVVQVPCAGGAGAAIEWDYAVDTGLFTWRRDPTMCLDAGTAVSCADAAVSGLPFCDPTLSALDRAADLLGRMLPVEKAAMLSTDNNGIPRLGIPALTFGEALHGVLVGCGAPYTDGSYTSTGCPTSFPTGLALGASFNRTLFHSVGDAIGREARALNNQGGASNMFFTPNINIFRDPRWGRGMEASTNSHSSTAFRKSDSHTSLSLSSPQVAGEDPVLVAEFAANYIYGFQGDNSGGAHGSSYVRSVSMPKHFNVYDQEGNGGAHDRTNFCANVSRASLASFFLPSFKAAIQRGHAGGVMCSANGEYRHRAPPTRTPALPTPALTQASRAFALFAPSSLQATRDFRPARIRSTTTESFVICGAATLQLLQTEMELVTSTRRTGHAQTRSAATTPPARQAPRAPAASACAAASTSSSAAR